jgi:hypothetical protein
MWYSKNIVSDVSKRTVHTGQCFGNNPCGAISSKCLESGADAGLMKRELLAIYIIQSREEISPTAKPNYV